MSRHENMSRPFREALPHRLRGSRRSTSAGPRVRAVARRSISNREGTQETSFYVQLELTGLSSVGNADAFLEHAIRGYSPETFVR